MDNSVKLISLLVKEKEIENEIELTKCPFGFAKLSTDLSNIRYKIECCKTRMKYKEKIQCFEAPEYLKEY